MHCCGVGTQIKEMHRLLKAWVPHELPTIEPNFQCVDMHIHSAKPANEKVLDVPPPECGGLTRAREHHEPQGMTNPIVIKITKAQVYDEAMRRCGMDDARDLQEALVEARELFPTTTRQADYTLTMSHRKRLLINRKMNQLLKPVDATFIRAPIATRAGYNPQNMWIWKGQQLIGAGGKVYKGLFYYVKNLTEDYVELVGGLKLSHPDAVKSLRLPYALTYASCQALTLKGVVRLSTESQNMTLRHLYVGISRATAASLVEVV